MILVWAAKALLRRLGILPKDTHGYAFDELKAALKDVRRQHGFRVADETSRRVEEDLDAAGRRGVPQAQAARAIAAAIRKQMLAKS
jgi:hypothetical protein